MKRNLRHCLGLLLALALAQGSANAQNATRTDNHEDFASLRHAVLNAISGATSRVWLASQYLTDGEIVSALFIAQYRKIDVQVLLGRHKARLYMSRLNYLKAQNIPVNLWPPTFNFPQPTGLLIDDQLLAIDGELNSHDKNRRFRLSYLDASEASKFAESFAAGVGQALPALPIPRPLVGRPSGATIRSPGASYGRPSAYQKSYTDAELQGSYRYDTVRERPESDMPTKLPDATIWERNLGGEQGSTQ